MDTLNHYQQAIKAVLTDYLLFIPHNQLATKLLFDDERSNYALLSVGRIDHRYIHETIIHVEILDGKIWIQYDGTEEGIAEDLVNQGIPRDQIVLGFKPAYIRPYTDYATA